MPKKQYPLVCQVDSTVTVQRIETGGIFLFIEETRGTKQKFLHLAFTQCLAVDYNEWAFGIRTGLMDLGSRKGFSGSRSPGNKNRSFLLRERVDFLPYFAHLARISDDRPSVPTRFKDHVEGLGPLVEVPQIPTRAAKVVDEAGHDAVA